ncbi:MAG: DUF63 family protein [Haloarculaceae archaeon]
MTLLPTGFALPPAPYLLVLVVAVAGVGALLYRAQPAVTEQVVLGLYPWVVVGSSCYVLYQVGGVPALLRPFFGTPAVYLTTFAVAGALWWGTDRAGYPTDRFALPSVPGVLAGAGVVVALVAAGLVLAVGSRVGGFAPGWPATAAVAALALTGVVWYALRRAVPAVRVTGGVGALVVFGHTLDGVSTAVGIDVLGFGEQTPLSRVLIELGSGLPPAAVVGTAWLFVLVKVAIAAAVVVFFVDYVREDSEGLLLLGAVGAVGLGPGVHNVLLFTVASV